MTEDTDIPHRERLLRFARTMGAGPDSEQLVHAALQALARQEGSDPHQVWAHLADLLAQRVERLHWRLARAETHGENDEIVR